MYQLKCLEIECIFYTFTLNFIKKKNFIKLFHKNVSSLVMLMLS